MGFQSAELQGFADTIRTEAHRHALFAQYTAQRADELDRAHEYVRAHDTRTVADAAQHYALHALAGARATERLMREALTVPQIPQVAIEPVHVPCAATAATTRPRITSILQRVASPQFLAAFSTLRRYLRH